MTAARKQMTVADLIVVLIIALALARLSAMALLPMMDTTEARYGEIARKMAQLGDWVTPWHADGIPFWGKPPLAFWASALCFRLFGVGEFAARLPHFLFALLTGAMVWDMARRQAGRRAALFAVAVLAGSTLFLVSAGAMMTDMALTLGTTMVMYGFWLAFEGEDALVRRRGGYLFFLGITVGLLAKGPLILALTGPALVLWVSLERRWKTVLFTLPWVSGTLLAALLVLPWYWLAERTTPGFLNYFIVGEHWHRFVTPGWQGDLYGRAHRYFPGTIWLFGLIALLPWSISLAIAAWWWRGRSPAVGPAAGRAWRRYIVLWALVPLVFLSAARNIIWTYPLPMVPALVLIVSGWLARRPPHAELWVATGLSIALALTVAACVTAVVAPGLFDRSTARSVVAAYLRNRGPDEPLVFLGGRPYSAAFYSGNQALQADGAEALAAAARRHRKVMVAVPDDGAGTLAVRKVLSVQTDFGRFGEYELLRVERPPASEAGEASSAERR